MKFNEFLAIFFIHLVFEKFGIYYYFFKKFLKIYKDKYEI